jgi:O-acetyl-ADP-ribose deacetylase (regulator of RNase III)
MKTINGNILDAKEQFIVHQTNSVSRGASGLAKSIFDRFPDANIYKNRPYPYVAKGEDLPGHIIIRGRIIAIGGQYYPGQANEKSLIDSSIVREGYFWQCLRQIAKIENLESIAFPFRIGSGLAGGNWEHYYKMIENFDKIVNESRRVDVVLYRLI